MAQTKGTLTADDLPRLVAVLDEGDRDAQCDALRELCPCRNRVYDRDVWLAILHADECHPDPAVRHQARHALETLQENAKGEPESHALLQFLSAREETGRLSGAGDGPILPGEVPHLLATLTGDDPEAQCAALRRLCPCRSRCYLRPVWRAIFALAERSEDAAVREAAHHAVETLQGRLRVDPRSQALVRDLAGECRTAAQLARRIPVWRPPPPPVPVGGTDQVIPVWERPKRSKANRRRR